MVEFEGNVKGKDVEERDNKEAERLGNRSVTP